MLYQLHQVHADGTSGFVAQREFDQHRTPEEFQAWIADVRAHHELPDGSQWWIHDETSPKFLLAKKG